MKGWRRAKSDMQLYFSELRKRDTLREEYSTVADSVDMLIDLHKVSMQYEAKDQFSKQELELNQVKYNIIDMIKSRLSGVRQKVGVSLIKDAQNECLNLQKYQR